MSEPDRKYVVVVFYDRVAHHNYTQYETARIRVNSLDNLREILTLAATEIFGLATALEKSGGRLLGGTVIENVNYSAFYDNPDAYTERWKKYFSKA